MVQEGNTVTVFTRASSKWSIDASDETYLDKDEVGAFEAGQIGTRSHGWSDLTVGQRAITIR